MARFLHSGKFGDLIYALWTIKALGGGEIWFNFTRGSICHKNSVEFCKPLLDKQPYIHGVNQITFGDNLSNDRGKKMFCRQDYNNPDFLILDNAWWWGSEPATHHWIHRYAYSFGVTVDPSTPILTIDREYKQWEDRPIIVNFTETFRTRNDAYYDQLLSRPDVIRVGDQPGDYKCKDMLELANMIGNSKFFVGNQSSCNAIAQALQHPRLVEMDYEYGDASPIGPCGFVVSDDLAKDINYLNGLSHVYWTGY